jgi:TRAP-type mannitol/chloroaromatic compound transport system permease large subunit
MSSSVGNRRTFIATASTTAATGELGFPAIVKAQTSSLRFQSTWLLAGTMPYTLIVILCMVLMYIFPGMTLWLPEFLYGK